jgi:hypothetical protein
MRRSITVLFAAIVLVALVVPLQAHHPFASQYDKDKPITMTGTVTKVDWANPHTHIFIDGKDQNGKMANWEFELGGIKKLKSLGWKKDTIKMGDQVTIEGWQARDGQNRGNANTVTKAGGQKMTAGSSYYEQAKERHTED